MNHEENILKKDADRSVRIWALSIMIGSCAGAYTSSLLIGIGTILLLALWKEK